MYRSIYINVISVYSRFTSSKSTLSKAIKYILRMSSEDGPVLRIAQGELRGSYFTTKGGVKVNSFQGIPYARPPVGKLRFQAPQPAEPWEGIWDATEVGNDCAQRDLIFRKLKGSEDCLYLNVYSPSLSDAPLPVMVWVHGGAFWNGSGSPDLYGPDFLVEADVVVVTINYRVGALGFLSLDTEKAPGNAGLKDQAAALRWVRDNISAFGGDPDNVTIFGESAGGASVHYLMVTDSTKGLFHKAISQSGSALNPWARTESPRQYALALCAVLDHPTTDLDDAFEFLQTVPAMDLVTGQEKIATPEQKRRNRVLNFLPTIENTYPGQEPFITVLERITSGKFHRVPYLTGFNSSEGILFLKDKKDDFYNNLNDDFERIIPPFVKVEQHTSLSKDIANKIKQAYCKNGPISLNNLQDYVNLTTDTDFVYGIYKTIQLQSSLSSTPIWVYRFSYDGFSLFKMIIGVDMPGVCHADDLLYLFKINMMPLPDPDLPVFKDTRNRFIKMWTNFAKTGNPTPEADELIPVKWEPVSKDKLNYLEFGEELSMKQNPDAERMAFWDELLRSLPSQDPVGISNI